jgi:hypothetical protein
MIQENIIKKNTEVIIRSIANDNKCLYLKIKKQYPTFTTTQIFTSLLLKLNYSTNEIVIILGITPESIKEVTELVNNLKSES